MKESVASTWELLRDDDEFARFYYEVNPGVRMLILPIVFWCQARADDIMQDVWAGIARDRWCKTGPIKKAYAKVVALRTAFHVRNDMARQRGRGGVDAEEDVLNLLDAAPFLEETEEGRELIALLNQAMEELPEEQREAIKMQYFDNLSLQEIADRQGISYAGAGTRVHSAKRKIRGALLPSGYEPEP